MENEINDKIFLFNKRKTSKAAMKSDRKNGRFVKSFFRKGKDYSLDGSS